MLRLLPELLRPVSMSRGRERARGFLEVSDARQEFDSLSQTLFFLSFCLSFLLACFLRHKHSHKREVGARDGGRGSGGSGMSSEKGNKRITLLVRVFNLD